MIPRLQLRQHLLTSARDETQHLPCEFGYLTVPANRNDPDGTQIKLAVVRIPAREPATGSPIIVLAGGPGGDAIDSARASLDRVAALASIGDVILLDQRGVGRSRPNLADTNRFDLPLEEPCTREAVIAEGRTLAAACADYWQAQGVDLSCYNTVDNADDVDTLRRALGVDQVRLVGGSYGSHLAFAVLKRHPGTVERAVLSGIEGPDDTIKLPSAVQRHLELVVALARADAKIAGAVPDLLGLIREIIERAHVNPVIVEGPDPRTKEPAKLVMGPYELQRFVARAAGSRAAIASLPADFEAFERGDFTRLAAHALAERRRGIGNAMAWAMDAASGLSEERRRRIAAEAPTTTCRDVIDLPHPHLREAIGVSDLGDDFRAPVRSDVAILLISGSLDGRTPPANAAAALQGLPNGHHLIVDGMSHGDGVPAQLESLAARFLATGEFETERLVEPFNFNPIDPPDSTRSA